MAFAIFRRHQRVMLATITLLAMFCFVVADPLTKLFQSSAPRPGNQTVATLYDRPVKQNDLSRLAAQRSRANRFLSAIVGNPSAEPFGGISTRELVDAMILEHEADELGIVATTDLAKQWLTDTFKERINGRLLEQIYQQQFRNEVTDEQLLYDLANQLRLVQVGTLANTPLVSPLDVFQDFRDQNERVSVNAVAFPVEDFVAQVPEPKPAEIDAFHARYKDRVANPLLGEPGFTTPRRGKVEFVSIDGKSLGVTATDEEVLARYEKSKSEGQYGLPPLARLPEDVFEADDTPGAVHTTAAEWDKGPDPARYRPLEEVRFLIEQDLIEDKIRSTVESKLDPIRELMNAYADARATALEDAAEKATSGTDQPTPTSTPTPPPPDLKVAALKAGMTYDSTPALTREQADKYGQIGDARIGAGGSARSVRFGDWLFGDRPDLYEPVEMADSLQRYFLAWKTEDLPPEAPPLDKIHDDVVRAWKLDQARPLARKAAEELADLARADAGDLRAVAGDRSVLTTTPVSRLQPSPPMFAQFNMNIPPRPNDLPPLQEVGDEIRGVAFGLDAAAVGVAANQSKSIYYALTPASRIPATFDSLYTPFGERLRLAGEARRAAEQRQFDEWMITLRKKAKLDSAWAPPDEPNRRRAPQG